MYFFKIFIGVENILMWTNTTYFILFVIPVEKTSNKSLSVSKFRQYQSIFLNKNIFTQCIFKQKCLLKQKCTIITSETELMESIYMVTPTITGSPENKRKISSIFVFFISWITDKAGHLRLSS